MKSPQLKEHTQDPTIVQSIDTSKLKGKKVVSPKKIKQRRIAERVIASTVTGESLSDIGRDLYPKAKYPRQTVYNALRDKGTQEEIQAIAKGSGLTVDRFDRVLSRVLDHAEGKDMDGLKPVHGTLLRLVGERLHVVGAQQETQKPPVNTIQMVVVDRRQLDPPRPDPPEAGNNDCSEVRNDGQPQTQA